MRENCSQLGTFEACPWSTEETCARASDATARKANAQMETRIGKSLGEMIPLAGRPSPDYRLADGDRRDRAQRIENFRSRVPNAAGDIARSNIICRSHAGR